MEASRGKDGNRARFACDRARSLCTGHRPTGSFDVGAAGDDDPAHDHAGDDRTLIARHG
jgi:hypothetical protein